MSLPLRITLKSPMTTTRNYTSFRVGECTEARFTKLDMASDGSTAETCFDKWTLGIKLDDLIQYCGFATNDTGVTETFTGTVFIDYEEVMVVGDLQPMLRSGEWAILNMCMFLRVQGSGAKLSKWSMDAWLLVTITYHINYIFNIKRCCTFSLSALPPLNTVQAPLTCQL